MKKTRNRYEESFQRSNPSLAYEDHKLTYVIEATYTPDFYDSDTGTYYETKGYWRPSDRRKILAVIKCNPAIKIVMVFQNPNLKISKSSNTTYAQWCDRHGIIWRKG
jgi:hypothetical protein